jgi:hypothetical protein
VSMVMICPPLSLPRVLHMATDNAAQVGRSHDFVAYSYLAFSATHRASSRSRLTAPTF